MERTGTRITLNDARRFGMVDLIGTRREHPLLEGSGAGAAG
jgi:hypothetical protein